MLIRTSSQNNISKETQLNYNPKEDFISEIRKYEDGDEVPYGIKVLKNSIWHRFGYHTLSQRNIAYKYILKQIKQVDKQTSRQTNKGESKMKAVKDYFEKHQETCITLGIIILVDHFVFNGAFQDKIKAMMNQAIGSVEEKLSPKKEETDEKPGE